MNRLPKGIVSVLQTPFDDKNRIDFASLEKLINESLNAGVSGFLCPVVASEVSLLSQDERKNLIEFVHKVVQNRVALVIGASSDDVVICRQFAQQALKVSADAFLVAVPAELYKNQDSIIPFLKSVSDGIELPLVVQDFQFNGPGMPVSIIEQLRHELPTCAGIKIETSPSGPKYTAVKKACGTDFWVAGGWAITQMIEALDRGVDAMIPESSMVRVYSKIVQFYSEGNRKKALKLFRSMQPVLMFSNQDVGTSVAFFKRLLVAKGIFQTAHMRWPGFEWDELNTLIADELIELYLEIENYLK